MTKMENDFSKSMYTFSSIISKERERDKKETALEEATYLDSD